MQVRPLYYRDFNLHPISTYFALLVRSDRKGFLAILCHLAVSKTLRCKRILLFPIGLLVLRYKDHPAR